MTEPTDVDIWLIDGFNVLHACILKGRERDQWWSQSAQAKVLAWLEPLARSQQVRVVFDARSEASPRCPRGTFSAQPCFAAHADDAIVELVRTSAGQRVCVVTADRSLADRSKRAGAHHLRPWDFQRLLRGE